MKPPETCQIARKSPSQSGVRHGFSLVELLVVMAIMIALVAVSARVMWGMGGQQSPQQAVHELALTFEQARSFAMANNTYVLVGFAERTTPDEALLVSAVASMDGTRNFSPDDVELEWRGVMQPKIFRGLRITERQDDDSAPVVRSAGSTFPNNFVVGSQTYGHTILFDPRGSASLPPNDVGPGLAVGMQRIHGGVGDGPMVQVQSMTGRPLVLLGETQN